MNKKNLPDLNVDDGLVKVRGAREHNLKNIDLDIPRNALVVFTLHQMYLLECDQVTVNRLFNNLLFFSHLVSHS